MLNIECLFTITGFREEPLLFNFLSMKPAFGSAPSSTAHLGLADLSPFGAERTRSTEPPWTPLLWEKKGEDEKGLRTS